VIAYKLLRPNGTAPFSGTQWPPPGVWLDAAEIESCRTGIHACRPAHLPFWLGLGELWEVELDGDVVEDERKIVAERGRLIRRVDEWNGETSRAFALECAAEARRRAERAPELSGYADDAAATPVAAVAAFIGARAAESQDGPAGYDAERRRQAEWLTRALRLQP
jgi:hypothetical protein